MFFKLSVIFIVLATFRGSILSRADPIRDNPFDESASVDENDIRVVRSSSLAENTEEITEDGCMKPPLVGKCKGLFERYYWNNETQGCEKFIYGGCGGNENNFNSTEECVSACSKLY